MATGFFRGKGHLVIAKQVLNYKLEAFWDDSREMF